MPGGIDFRIAARSGERHIELSCKGIARLQCSPAEIELRGADTRFYRFSNQRSAFEVIGSAGVGINTKIQSIRN